jgi:hypothetical protein
MKIISVALTSIFVHLFFLQSFSQNNFKSGIMLGVNLAQIHGDKQQGYNKLGASVGVKGEFNLAQSNINIVTELFYNQRGSKYTDDAKYRDKSAFLPEISLHYADITGLASYNFGANHDQTSFKYNIFGGLSYGRLFNSKTRIIRNLLPEEPLSNAINNAFNSNDISFIAGWSFYLTNRLGLTLRHQVSLNKLYSATPSVSTTEKESFTSFRPFSLSFQVFYNFISPKMTVAKTKKKKKEIDPLEKL